MQAGTGRDAAFDTLAAGVGTVARGRPHARRALRLGRGRGAAAGRSRDRRRGDAEGRRHPDRAALRQRRSTRLIIRCQRERSERIEKRLPCRKVATLDRPLHGERLRRSGNRDPAEAEPLPDVGPGLLVERQSPERRSCQPVVQRRNHEPIADVDAELVTTASARRVAVQPTPWPGAGLRRGSSATCRHSTNDPSRSQRCRRGSPVLGTSPVGHSENQNSGPLPSASIVS